MLNNKIAIIGLGYVGLPLALAFGEKFKTIGFKLKNTEFVDLNDKNDLSKLKIYYKNFKK